MAKSEEEILNEQKFGNRRKMAFLALYTLIVLVGIIGVKIFLVEPESIGHYSSIINTLITILGGVVLSFIGAAAYEQTRNPILPGSKRDDK